ncbi:hypothetical protein NPIL_58811 [Nephila pilipes]|uniref:Uncharacterized protein n=1 Tax=Nephila pilipes TaxID=299642 RepID=A0A8X6PMQ3_NEPPI|nr:hypothetical protein NPIL_58811 [Nephila pilipes]
MLSSVGFVLRIWASYHNDLLNSIDLGFCLSDASLSLDNDKTEQSVLLLIDPVPEERYFTLQSTVKDKQLLIDFVLFHL